MGDIADMHVEAYAAGLDPNEMDGADCADFYDDADSSGFPPNPWLIWHEARSFVEWLDAEADEAKGDAVDVLMAYFPNVGDASGALAALRSIAAHQDPEDIGREQNETEPKIVQVKTT